MQCAEALVRQPIAVCRHASGGRWMDHGQGTQALRALAGQLRCMLRGSCGVCWRSLAHSDSITQAQ